MDGSPFYAGSKDFTLDSACPRNTYIQSSPNIHAGPFPSFGSTYEITICRSYIGIFYISGCIGSQVNILAKLWHSLMSYSLGFLFAVELAQQEAQNVL